MSSSSASADLDYRDTSAQFTIPAIILNILSTIFVGLRLYSRRVQGLKLQFDDYIVVVALCFNHGMLADELVLKANGLGISGETLMATRKGGVTLFLRTFFVLQLVYSCTSPLSKISILALYYRIFYVSRSFRMAVWGMTALLIGWGISVFVASIFSCNPINGFWDITIGAKCFDSSLFFMAITIPNIIFDAITIFLPVREVWSLQMRSDRKWALTGMFVLGILVVCAAVARLVTVQLYKPAGGSLNTTQALVPALIATGFEVNFAILGACLPPIMPLWKRWTSKSTASSPKSSAPFSSIVTFGQGSSRKNNSKNSPYETYADEADGGFERLNDGASVQTSTENLYGTKGQKYKFDVQAGVPLQKMPGRPDSWQSTHPEQVRVDRTVNVQHQEASGR
ncbi:hypothetical protein GGR56DRAFT_697722 [Xylariaceae sp. FL0804]|nr:hypothetical protein GGR56DRAFT_697722 [Xylariaceae sp. FL0804]